MRPRDERGSIAPAIPVIAMVLFLLGGLGVDGARQLNARGQAVAFAEEAARAGAQGVDIDETDLVLDRDLVRQRVDGYCREVRERGYVEECRLLGIDKQAASDKHPLVVSVQVRLSVPATLLGMVGVRELNARAIGKARPYEGISSPVE